MNGMDHVSISQIKMHARCQEQWRRRYPEGEVRPPGIAGLVGGGLHKGAELACRHKAQHGENMPAGDVRDVTVAGFDSRAEDGVHLGAEERSVGKQAILGRGRDRAAAFGHYWGLVVQPDYVPLSEEYVEWRWSIPLPTLGLDLVGVVDLVQWVQDGPIGVIDWKTGTRKLSQRDADTSLQLVAYSLATVREFRERALMPGRFEQLVDTKAGTKRHTVLAVPGRADYQRLLSRVAVFVKSVRAGMFVPCDPVNWWCSARWCGYADTCRYYVPELEGA